MSLKKYVSNSFAELRCWRAEIAGDSSRGGQEVGQCTHRPIAQGEISREVQIAMSRSAEDKKEVYRECRL